MLLHNPLDGSQADTVSAVFAGRVVSLKRLEDSCGVRVAETATVNGAIDLSVSNHNGVDGFPPPVRSYPHSSTLRRAISSFVYLAF